MGNVCSGGNEATKKGAFLENESDASAFAGNNHKSHEDAIASGRDSRSEFEGGLTDPNALDGGSGTGQLASAVSAGLLSSIRSNNTASTNGSSNMEQVRELEQKLYQEQARLMGIVQKTGRAMVSVRSTRGSTVYYDQGFAAALSQHLEQTISTSNSSSNSNGSNNGPNQVAVRLPPAPKDINEAALANPTDPSNNTVYSILSQPQWEGICISGHSSSTATTSHKSNAALTDGSSSAPSTTNDNPNVNETTTTSSGSTPSSSAVASVASVVPMNPVAYMDQVCQLFLESVVPRKERLYTNAPPILETLLS